MRDAEAEAVHHLSEAVLAGHARWGASAGMRQAGVSDGAACSDAGELATAKLGLLSGSATEEAFVRRWVRDADNRDAESVQLDLPAGQSLLLEDVIETLFTDTGAAALAINATDGLMATSRTFNDAASGTFGQLVPGMDPSDDTTLRPGRLGHLAQLEQSSLATGRRTNLGLVNLGEDPLEVEVRFFAGDGSALGELNPQLPPFGYIQINEALTEIGAADVANVRAEIEVLTDGGRVLAYASTIDNRTGDPVFQMAWTHD